MDKKQFSQKVIDLKTSVDTIFKKEDTIDDALLKLQSKLINQKVIYFYIVDENDCLIGVVPTRKLLLFPKKTKMFEIMIDSIIKLDQDQTLQDAFLLFSKHHLLALPVVDENQKILGVIDLTSHMNFNLTDAHNRNDIFQIIGYTLEEEKKKSIFGDYKLRMPWIFCNIFGGIMCAIISRAHEQVISKVLILAMFIPLVLSLSESVSMQAMIHSLHFFSRPEDYLKKIFKKMIKELKIISLISISSGLIVGVISLLFKEGVEPSLIISIGIVISIFISSAFGILIPLLLHKTKLDPKVASGPVVLMVSDIITTLLYFSLASAWLF
ncbi:MAG: Magnesium transporter MgtE [Candidatus Anoxychlamydiales bacterium]|nr:Magnesium transporter MgtE [Candidatus Anoxychlamydiales bacterium]